MGFNLSALLNPVEHLQGAKPQDFLNPFSGVMAAFDPANPLAYEQPLDPLDLINTHGDFSVGNLLSSAITDPLDPILDPGKSDREAAAQAQQAAGDQAIQFQKDALAQTRQDLSPFREFGAGVIPSLQNYANNYNVNPILSINNDPNRVLQDPFYQALAKDQENRLLNRQAALGRANSGGTRDILTRNLLLLGDQFRQNDINNQFQQQQQNFQNTLAGNEQYYNQLLQGASLGENAAALTGNATQQTGNNISEYLTQIGNVNAASNIASGNQKSQNLGALAGLAAAAIAAFSDIRLKENIARVGVDGENLPIYSFNYTWDKTIKYLGHMAQDIIKKHPEHVFLDEDGYYLVSNKYAPMVIDYGT